jgi:hypothetical protein
MLIKHERGEIGRLAHTCVSSLNLHSTRGSARERKRWRVVGGRKRLRPCGLRLRLRCRMVLEVVRCLAPERDYSVML